MEKRDLEQWFLRITTYADELLDFAGIDWPEPIRVMQTNWIGRSEGGEIVFRTAASAHHAGGEELRVFTTRPDTLFGATYMVLAPEHPLVDVITPTEWPGSQFDDAHSEVPVAWRGIFGDGVGPAAAVRVYREFAGQKSELERQAEGHVKTGVFTGAFAVNPVNGARIPVFIADYVLMGYGTGAIMAVPAHDERDFAFAREFDLPIIPVVRPDDAWLAEHGVAADDASEWDEAFTGVGVAMASGNDGVTLDGLDTPSAKAAINAWLAAEGLDKDRSRATLATLWLPPCTRSVRRTQAIASRALLPSGSWRSSG